MQSSIGHVVGDDGCGAHGDPPSADPLGADIAAILDTVDIAIVVVGRDCKVARFNRAATAALGLTPSDIGRLPCNIRALADMKDIEKVCRQVIADAAPCRREVRNGDRSFLVHIAPYAASDRQVSGAVLTFTNVTAFRACIAEAIYEREYTKAILNTVIQPLVVLDCELRVQTANRAFYAMFGVLREQAQGIPLCDLGDRDWKEGPLWSSLKATLRGAGSFQTTEVERGFAIGRRTVLLDARRLSHDGGAGDMILLAFHDITERKEAEQALLHGERQFRRMIDVLPAAIYTTDAQGRLTHFNPACVEFSGRTPELGSDHWCVTWKLFHPDGRPMPHDECPMAIALKTGRVIRGAEAIAERPDGTRVWFMPYPTPLFDDADNIVGGINMLVDITDRKRAEETLRASERELSDFFETADTALHWVGPDGVVLRVNQAELDMLGYTRQECLGRHIAEFHVDQPVIEDILARMTRGETLRQHPARLRRKDGSIREVLINSSVLFKDGRFIHTRCFTHDVTEQKQAEEQLRQAKQEAEAANRAKDVFLANLSHEIRTPLNAVLGWAVVLRNAKPTGAELEEGLASIERNAKAQAQLIEDVLDVSRIVSGKIRLDIRRCDLAATITAAIDAIRAATDAKEVELLTDLDPSAGVMSCDATRIQQVVWNLLSNAIKFTPRGGTVCVRLVREHSDAVIKVSDTGQGIAPEFLPHVFERFRQAEGGTKRKLGGLGLGLSIVRHIVELHGGTVEALSEGPGQGATFIVRLPVHAVHEDRTAGADAGEPADHEQYPRAAGPEVPLARLDGLRILVVDDEPDARLLVAKSLEIVGAAVTMAQSAREALDLLSEAHPHVLVSDLGMPMQDGYDLIQAIRSAGHDANDLPAVALTAFAHNEHRRRALLAGFQVHIVKPVDPHDLIAAIAGLAGRTGARTETE
jgi:PAS domain S-box-containing protein